MFMLTPAVFSLFFLFMFFMFFMFSVTDFFFFWFFMEVSTLFFIGIGLGGVIRGVSQFMSFVVVQAVSSLLLVFFYMLDSGIGLSVMLIFKLAMFPFFIWFVSVSQVLIGFYLFLIMTVFKIPAIVLFGGFIFKFNVEVVMVAVVFNVFIGGAIMLGAGMLRTLLVGSSVGNNSWFIMSQLADSILFIILMVVYSFFLALIFWLVGTNLSFSSFFSSVVIFGVVLSLLFISGLPPFPMFFLKVFIVWGIVMNFLYFAVLVLLFNVMVVLGYFKFIFSLLVSSNMLGINLKF